MTKASEFAPQYRQAIIDAGDDGLSAAEIRELVPSSRQGIYAWVRANTRNLQPTHTSPMGGMRYRWIERPQRRATNADGIEVGAQLTITRMRISDGQLTITVETSDGEHADLTMPA
jgi:hypothetical protein